METTKSVVRIFKNAFTTTERSSSKNKRILSLWLKKCFASARVAPPRLGALATQYHSHSQNIIFWTSNPNNYFRFATRLDSYFSSCMFCHLTITAAVCACIEKQFVEVKIIFECNKIIHTNFLGRQALCRTPRNRMVLSVIHKLCCRTISN
jgi:hypothetical protein